MMDDYSCWSELPCLTLTCRGMVPFDLYDADPDPFTTACLVCPVCARHYSLDYETGPTDDYEPYYSLVRDVPP